MVFHAFSLPTTEILNLTSRIYKLTQTLIYLKSRLPQIALEQYTQTCLIDEVKLTNEIEGVNSTRREIQDILNTQSITQKNMRLYGLVQKYNLLKNSEKISIHNCSDIRNIYNELVSEEIKNNDPLNLPDGIFFRKKILFRLQSTYERNSPWNIWRNRNYCLYGKSFIYIA